MLAFGGVVGATDHRNSGNTTFIPNQAVLGAWTYVWPMAAPATGVQVVGEYGRQGEVGARASRWREATGGAGGDALGRPSCGEPGLNFSDDDDHGMTPIGGRGPPGHEKDEEDVAKQRRPCATAHGHPSRSRSRCGRSDSLSTRRRRRRSWSGSAVPEG